LHPRFTTGPQIPLKRRLKSHKTWKKGKGSVNKGTPAYSGKKTANTHFPAKIL